MIMTFASSSLLNSAKPQNSSKPLTISINQGKDGPKTPQTKDRAWVPQGLDYLPTHRWLILSHYYDRGRGSEGNASKLSAVNIEDGKHIKTVDLYENNNQKHFGHVGGVTATLFHLYVASSLKNQNLLLRYSIDKFAKTAHGGKLVPDQVLSLNHRTSYTKYDPLTNRLFIGEWTPQKKDSHGNLYSYQLDKDGDLSNAETYRTPTDVQGIEFFNNLVLYSISTGRKKKSTLSIHDRLGKSIKKLPLPSMSQGIVIIKTDKTEKLYSLHESDTAKYANGGIEKSPNVKMHELNIKER